MINYSKTVLKNGLRVIVAPIPGNPTVTVSVAVEAGSKYENKKNNGISHFLEHMCFKGTTKRPKALMISSELDAIGANYNAFTSHEHTGYYAKADKKHFSKILDIVSDMYLNPTFEESEITKEKGVIVEEINMYADRPEAIVGDNFMQLLYGDTPAGWNIAGTKENVTSFNRQDFIEYRKNNYVPQATIVTVAGDVDEKTVIAEVEKAFGGMPEGEKATKLKVVENQNKPEMIIGKKETDQTHLILGVRAFDFYDKRKTTLGVLKTILGGGMSSRIWNYMRNDLGIAYYVHVSYDGYTDHGNFTVSAGVDSKRIPVAIEAILNELRKIKNELVSEEELQRAKEGRIARMNMSLETSDDITSFFGSQEVDRLEIKTPEQIEAEIRAVTAEDIKKLTEELFVTEKLNLSIVGKIDNGGELEKLLKI